MLQAVECASRLEFTRIDSGRCVGYLIDGSVDRGFDVVFNINGFGFDFIFNLDGLGFDFGRTGQR
jgi:hypothetical protein